MKICTLFGPFALLVGLCCGCGRSASPTGEASTVGTSAANPETAEAVLKELAGDWRVVSVQNLPPGYSPDVKNVTAHVQGNVIELSESIGYLSRAEIRLDPTKSPKEFDLIVLDKAGKPRTIEYFTTGGPSDGKKLERPVAPVKGLYSLDGDRLTIAVTDRDDYRPTELKAAVMENTGPFVTVNRRGSTHVAVVELARVKAGAPNTRSGITTGATSSPGSATAQQGRAGEDEADQEGRREAARRRAGHRPGRPGTEPAARDRKGEPVPAVG